MAELGVISLKELLEDFYINEVKSLIGGRIILIEVEGDDSDTLINRYKSIGFDSFGKLEDLTQLMIFTKSY